MGGSNFGPLREDGKRESQLGKIDLKQRTAYRYRWGSYKSRNSPSNRSEWRRHSPRGGTHKQRDLWRDRKKFAQRHVPYSDHWEMSAGDLKNRGMRGGWKKVNKTDVRSLNRPYWGVPVPKGSCSGSKRAGRLRRVNTEGGPFASAKEG